MSKYLYISLDESGELQFFRETDLLLLLTSVAKERPFEAFKAYTIFDMISWKKGQR
ncbi:MAG TPA: hypothetical protein VIS99_11425 [Terrimicrobiaceae bacterium]